MIELEKSNYPEYMKKIEDRYKDFSLKYMSTFTMLLDRENRVKNMERLLLLIETLKEIKYGNRDKDIEFNKFKESLANEYIYPKFGGKRAFEHKMRNGKKK